MQALPIFPQLPLPMAGELLMKRIPQEEKPPNRAKKVHYQLRELDVAILQYVREYYVLTSWQLVNLHYAPGSLTYAQTKLQILSGNKVDIPSEAYLRRRGLYPLTFGNTIQIYYLGTPGINYLKNELGLPVTIRHTRLDKLQELSYPPLIHALNVNDVLIAGRNLTKVAPDIRLAAFLHDFDLQTTPAHVELERRLKEGGMVTERVKIVPDGMLDFRLKLANTDKERRRILLPEIDRGTETNIEEFKKKIRAYVYYAYPDGAFEEQFGKANKRVVWIVTKGGENRMNTIRKWCEDELAEQELEHEWNLFRFTTLDQVMRTDKKTGQVKKSEELAINPYTLFLTAVAYKPFHEAPDTLLWKP